MKPAPIQPTAPITSIASCNQGLVYIMIHSTLTRRTQSTSKLTQLAIVIILCCKKKMDVQCSINNIGVFTHQRIHDGEDEQMKVNIIIIIINATIIVDGVVGNEDVG